MADTLTSVFQQRRNRSTDAANSGSAAAKQLVATSSATATTAAEESTARAEEKLYQKWPGREDQLASLLHLISGHSCSHTGILVFGPAATGKTGIVLDVLQHRGAAYGIVDSGDFVRDRELLSSLLLQLAVHDEEEQQRKSQVQESQELSHPTQSFPSGGRKRRNGGAALVGTDLVTWQERMTDFTSKLNDFPALSDHTLFLVLENYEKLHVQYPNMIPSLFRLQEAALRSVCVILIGRRHMSDVTSGFHLFPVSFPAYKTRELHKILKQTVFTASPSISSSSEVVDAFLRYCVDAIINNTRDLRETEHVVSSVWPSFVQTLRARSSSGKAAGQAVDEKEAAAEHAENTSNVSFSPAVVTAALKDVGPLIRRLVKIMYHHEQDVHPLPSGAAGPGIGHAAASSSSSSSSARAAASSLSSTVSQSLISLPTSARFLVVAAFLASFNPPTQDRQLFSAVGGKRKRKKSRTTSIHDHSEDTTKKTRAKLPLVLLGPKPFPLDRMLAIFNVINPDAEQILEPYSQVAHLISMKVFSNLERSKSERGALEDVKLLCNITLDDAKAVAETIELDLAQFIFDPTSQQGSK